MQIGMSYRFLEEIKKKNNTHKKTKLQMTVLLLNLGIENLLWNYNHSIPIAL